MVTIEGLVSERATRSVGARLEAFRRRFTYRMCVLLEVEPVWIHCIVVLQFHRSSHSHLSTLSLVM